MARSRVYHIYYDKSRRLMSELSVSRPKALYLCICRISIVLCITFIIIYSRLNYYTILLLYHPLYPRLFHSLVMLVVVAINIIGYTVNLCAEPLLQWNISCKTVIPCSTIRTNTNNVVYKRPVHFSNLQRQLLHHKYKKPSVLNTAICP